MHRYVTLFTVLVTLTLAGCAGSGTQTGESSPLRTPSGGEISDRLPDFGSTAPTGATSQPLPTAQSGRAASTPYYQQHAAKDLPPVKVGLLVPLTGPQAALGQALLNAAQLALFDVGANNIMLVPSDTSLGAVKAADEVLGEGAQIILGPLFAADVKAISPIARAHNVSVIAFSTDWTAATDNTYIMGFLPFGQVSRVVDFATKHGARRFAAIIPQTPYGMVVNGSLKNEAQRQGMEPPQSLIFNDANGLNQAVQALTTGQRNVAPADAVMLPLGGAQLSQAATLLRQNNGNLRNMRLLGTGLWDDSAPAASLLAGSWYAAPDPRLRAAFNSQYRATYGGAPPRLATLAYDATALAAALAAKGQVETGYPAYDRAALTNPSGFSGLDGVFRFRSDGLAERGLAVLEIRPTGTVIIDPAPTRF